MGFLTLLPSRRPSAATFIETPATIRSLGRRAKVWGWLRRRVNFTRHYPDVDFFVLSSRGHDVKAVGRPFQYGRRTCRSTAGISRGTCAKMGDAMRYIATWVTDELLAHSSVLLANYHLI